MIKSNFNLIPLVYNCCRETLNTFKELILPCPKENFNLVQNEVLMFFLFKSKY